MRTASIFFVLVSVAASSASAVEVKYTGFKYPKERLGECSAIVTIDEAGNVLRIEGHVADPKDKYGGLYESFTPAQAHKWDVNRDKKTKALKGVRAESTPTDHLFGGLPSVLELKDLDKGKIKLKIKHPYSFHGFGVYHRTKECSDMEFAPPPPPAVPDVTSPEPIETHEQRTGGTAF
jgi:hypothetical protein